MSRILIPSVIQLGTHSNQAITPILLSAVVENSNQSNVILVFNIANTTYNTSDFFVTDRVVSSITHDVTNKIITLTLDNPVYYFNTLSVRITDLGFFPIINNVTDDGLTIARYDTSIASGVVQSSGVESIYWDLKSGYSLRGSEESTGTTIPFGVYEITATQTNHFYTGCTVGAIFPAASAITLDGNNKVKRVLGNHLSQPVVAKRPTNGVFNGTGNSMKTAPFTYNQPEFVYIVFKQISWINSENIIDGEGNTTMCVQQNGVTPKVIGYAGTASAQISGPAIGAIGIMRCLFNGANSSLQVNENTKWTGNLGAANAGGFTLARFGADDNSAWGNIKFIAAILRHNVDSDHYQNSFYNYLVNKYNPTPPAGRSFASITRFLENPILPHNTAAWNAFGLDTIYADFKNKIGSYYYTMTMTCATSEAWEYLACYRSLDMINWSAFGSNPVFSARPGKWDSNLVTHPSVIKIGDVFHMYYGAHDGLQNYRIGLATSTDFVNWTRHSDTYIYKPASTGASIPCVILIGSTYYMYYWNVMTGANTKMEYATSPDGLIWTYAGIIFGKSTSGEVDYLDASTLLIDSWVIKNKNNYYEMVYTAVTVPNTAIPQVVCYAVSWDGITWFKKRQIFGKYGSGWESGYVGDPVLLELPDGTARIYYNAWSGNPGISCDGGLITVP